MLNFSTGADENFTEIAEDGATKISKKSLHDVRLLRLWTQRNLRLVELWHKSTGFLLLNDKEIFAEIWLAPKEDEEDDDKGEIELWLFPIMILSVCFSIGLGWNDNNSVIPLNW